MRHRTSVRSNLFDFLNYYNYLLIILVIHLSSFIRGERRVGIDRWMDGEEGETQQTSPHDFLDFSNY